MYLWFVGGRSWLLFQRRNKRQLDSGDGVAELVEADYHVVFALDFLEFADHALQGTSNDGDGGTW